MDVTLEIKRGSKKTRAIRLRAEETLLGRHSECDMRIPSGAVSRKHCKLCFRDGYLTIEDLGSSNGTFVNGSKVRGVRALLPGDLLEVGPVTFLVKYELTGTAREKLRKDVPAPVDSGEIVDVEPVDEDEILDVLPVDDDKQTAHFELPKKKSAPPRPPSKKKTTAPAPKPAEELAGDLSPGEVSDMFDGPLTIPVENDLRDLLTGLDEDEK